VVSGRDINIMIFRDLARSIDYLEMRKDIDAAKLGYTSFSWAAAKAPIYLSIEKRIKAAVLVPGGFPDSKIDPEIDPFNFLIYVQTPVLILNGKLDHALPSALTVGIFKLLGTSEQDKKQILYDSDHSVPKEERIK
jgi:dienelactone hydrolase